MWANLGARLRKTEPGDVVVEARLTADAHGFPTSRGAIVQGGAIAALADMALASAGATVAPEGRVATTVDLKIDFLQPAQPGPGVPTKSRGSTLLAPPGVPGGADFVGWGSLLARARVQRRTRRLCFTAGSVEQEDGTVVAEARALLAYVAR